MEIHGVNTRNTDEFPFSALRVLGAVQIGLGTVCMIMGITDLVLSLVNQDSDSATFTSSSQQKMYDDLITLTIVSTPIWCGMWFVVTGSLGSCVSKHRTHSLKFFKVAFMVLSILCAAVFAPASSTLTGIIALDRHSLQADDARWIVPMITCFVSFCEILIAIVTASYCCCCSSVQLTKVHVLFADSPTKSREPMYNVYTSDDVPSKTLTPRSITPILPVTYANTKNVAAIPRHEQDGQPRVVDSENTLRNQSVSPASYHKLKKWALPSSH